MDLLGGSRSTMEGEREAPFYFGQAGVRKKRQSTVGEEGEGYKYLSAPNGHLSRGSAASRKTAGVRVKCRLFWLLI